MIQLFANLTQALKTAESPLRLHLDARYPNQKAIYKRYRDNAGPILVPQGVGNPGTVGSAFDWLVRFMVCAKPSLSLAAMGALGLRSAVFHELTALLTGRSGGGRTDPGEGRYDGPAPILADEDLAYRAMWALALFTDIYRVGVHPMSPLVQLHRSGASLDQLLALAPDGAVQQLAELRKHAEERLLPPLRQREDRWALGPTFDGSKILKADADLIVGGLLVDIKTSVGSRSNGTPRATLGRYELWQIICYALMDFSDRYRITEVGLYSARYGYLTGWNLAELLAELRGSAVDIAEERRLLKDVLRRQQGVR